MIGLPLVLALAFGVICLPFLLYYGIFWRFSSESKTRQRDVMKRAFWLSSAVLVVLSGLWMIEAGIYGWTIFVVLPVALGALGGCLAVTAWRSVWYGALAVGIATLSLLFVGKEGIGCILISWPIMLPMGALGGFLVHAFRRRSEWARAASTFAILPLVTLGFDVSAKAPLYQVQTSIEIAASPDRVWKNVISFRDLPSPSEWYFHTGLAYPVRTRIDGSGVGGVRYCEFSTGPMVEPIRIWEEARVLQFDVISNPEPLTEWTLYGKPHPRHLNGYLIAKRGQFRLTPLPGGRTLLEGTSWYQHGLGPAPYWHVWSDAIIHRIHLRVLQHIKMLSENSRVGGRFPAY
jgi:hypothetical protein